MKLNIEAILPGPDVFCFLFAVVLSSSSPDQGSLLPLRRTKARDRFFLILFSALCEYGILAISPRPETPLVKRMRAGFLFSGVKMRVIALLAFARPPLNPILSGVASLSALYSGDDASISEES